MVVERRTRWLNIFVVIVLGLADADGFRGRTVGLDYIHESIFIFSFRLYPYYIQCLFSGFCWMILNMFIINYRQILVIPLNTQYPGPTV